LPRTKHANASAGRQAIACDSVREKTLFVVLDETESQSLLRHGGLPILLRTRAATARALIASGSSNVLAATTSIVKASIAMSTQHLQPFHPIGNAACFPRTTLPVSAGFLLHGFSPGFAHIARFISFSHMR